MCSCWWHNRIPLKLNNKQEWPHHACPCIAHPIVQGVDILGVANFFRVPHLWKGRPKGEPQKAGMHSQQSWQSGLAPPLAFKVAKMFWLRVALLLLVCCTTRSCWAQSNATLTSIPAQPCSGSYNQDVSLYSSDIYTVFANLSLCPDLETNGTVVRTCMSGFWRNHNLPDWSYQCARVAELGFLLARVWLRETMLVR